MCQPPILMPGDKIHLAFPLRSGLTAEEAKKEAQEINDQMTTWYRKAGVEILISSANTSIQHPMVVAVFRAS